MNIAKIHGKAFRQHQASGWRHSVLVTLEDGTRTHVSAAKRSELRRRLLRRGLTAEQIAEAFAGESEAGE
jgi:SOS response regulatory protein OraA/RecX